MFAHFHWLFRSFVVYLHARGPELCSLGVMTPLLAECNAYKKNVSTDFAMCNLREQTTHNNARRSVQARAQSVGATMCFIIHVPALKTADLNLNQQLCDLFFCACTPKSFHSKCDRVTVNSGASQNEIIFQQNDAPKKNLQSKPETTQR